MLKNERGVTLVALAIITIVLLILAAVTLSMVIGGGVMDGSGAKITIAEIDGKVNTAFSTVNTKFAEEGYPSQAIEIGESTENTEENTALSRAMYIYNDLNDGNSKFKNALPAGYELKSAKLDGAKINLELSVNGAAYKVLYDAVAEKATVSE